MMTHLQCRIERLFARPVCPLCSLHKLEARTEDEIRSGATSFDPSFKAAVRFYCGLVIAIDGDDEFCTAGPCAVLETRMLDEIDTEADAVLKWENREHAK